jgi:CTP:molybdopterin cytidylyltransferase MocA
VSERFAAVVLAAGLGTRFGGHKMLALLEGRPVLQHVLDALAVVEPADTVVVLGSDADALGAAIEWRSARRIVNPAPERGLSSSLIAGVAAAASREGDPPIEAILVCLGDQPRLRPDVVRALVDAETDRPIVAPRYADDGSRNPVLLRRPAWRRAMDMTGDSGLGSFIHAHPELVLEIAFAGGNPDVDLPDDLEVV